jgi:hypothetical protein
MLARLALGIAIAFSVSGGAGATLVPITQQRSVQAEGWVASEADLVEDADSASAPGFGPFAETAQVQLALGPFSGANATATQTSSIGGSLVLAEGSARASGFLDFGDTANISSASQLELAFELAIAGPWDVQASVDHDEGLGSFFAEIVLQGPGGTLLHLLSDDAFAGRLDLAPGQYTLRARAVADANPDDIDSDSGRASFSLRLAEVPEPGTLALVGLGALLLGTRRRKG